MSPRIPIPFERHFLGMLHPTTLRASSSVAHESRHRRLIRPSIRPWWLFPAALVLFVASPMGGVVAIALPAIGLLCLALAGGAWAYTGASRRTRRARSAAFAVLGAWLLSVSVFPVVVSAGTSPAAVSGNLPAASSSAHSTVQMLVTAYCTTGRTASGAWTRRGIAAATLPFGTHLYVPGYGVAVVADRGGAVGGNHVDLYMRSCANAVQWGARTVPVQIGW